MTESDRSEEISRVLRAIEKGSAVNMDLLMPLVYDELHAIAVLQAGKERRGHTLQPTALVNEAYLRLAGQVQVGWECKRHFFAAAAMAMRQILIDHARRRGRQKRGGSRRRIPLDALELASRGESEEILAVEEAICRLEQQDKRMAELVRLRAFVGLSDNDIAGVLGISERTVRREWAFARAWLQRAISKE